MSGRTTLEMHISILVIYFSDGNTSPNAVNSKAHQGWMNVWEAESGAPGSREQNRLTASPSLLPLGGVLGKGRKEGASPEPVWLKGKRKQASKTKTPV